MDWLDAQQPRELGLLVANLRDEPLRVLAAGKTVDRLIWRAGADDGKDEHGAES